MNGEHDEFERRDAAAKAPAGKDLARAYAACFSSEAGQRVLADLQVKFSHKRSRFSASEDLKHPIIHAARIDGECGVMKEIEDAITLGTPLHLAHSP